MVNGIWGTIYRHRSDAISTPIYLLWITKPPVLAALLARRYNKHRNQIPAFTLCIGQVYERDGVDDKLPGFNKLKVYAILCCMQVRAEQYKRYGIN